MRHPGLPDELRGTYAGLAHEAAVQHLVDVGITTVAWVLTSFNLVLALLAASLAGNLYLANKRSAEAFSEEDVDMVEALAERIVEPLLESAYVLVAIERQKAALDRHE